MSKKKQKDAASTAIINDVSHNTLPAFVPSHQQDYEARDQALNLEIKELHVTERKLLLQEKQLQIDQLDFRRLAIEERRNAIEAVSVITNSMRFHCIDADRTILGSEPFQMPIFDEYERDLLKKKVFELLERY